MGFTCFVYSIAVVLSDFSFNLFELRVREYELWSVSLDSRGFLFFFSFFNGKMDFVFLPYRFFFLISKILFNLKNCSFRKKETKRCVCIYIFLDFILMFNIHEIDHLVGLSNNKTKNGSFGRLQFYSIILTNRISKGFFFFNRFWASIPNF